MMKKSSNRRTAGRNVRIARQLVRIAKSLMANEDTQWVFEPTTHTYTEIDARGNEGRSHQEEWFGNTLSKDSGSRILSKEDINAVYNYYFTQQLNADECWIDEYSINFVKYDCDKNGNETMKHEYELLVRPPEGVSTDEAMDAISAALTGKLDDLR